MAVIDSAYHYYLSTYGNSAVSRYDSHKKSELRNIYNSILKINKDSPLYKVKHNEDVPQFLIDIKEQSRQLKNVVASLSDNTNSLEGAFQKKVAYSTDEDIVAASYIGSETKDEPSLNFDIEVRQLAAPQINLGNFLNNDDRDIEPGDYSFDLTTTNNSYEFQYTVSSEDNNRSIQEKLERLINHSNIGLTAEVITDEKNRSALKITSRQTGLNENQDFLFTIKPSANADSIRAMDLLGFQQLSTPAKNSSFILNGIPHSSYSNTFTLNNTFELTLNGISPEETPANIGFKTSIDAVSDNLQKLVNAYNGFIETGEHYSSSPQGNRLLHDLKAVSHSYQSSFEDIGLVIADNGSISIDNDLLAEAIDTENPDTTFSVLNSFKNALYTKANNASIDPIQYVDKIIVTYKQPGRNFFSPYNVSIYSGIMLDKYC